MKEPYPMIEGLKLFGKIALKNRLLTEEELQEALLLQEEAGKIGLQENLGTVCMRLGYLNVEDVEKILKVQLRKEIKEASKRYQNIALENKLVTEKQVEEALRVQKDQGFRSPIGQYLLKLGHLSLKNHQNILEASEKIRTILGKRDEKHSAASISSLLAETQAEIARSKKNTPNSSRQKKILTKPASFHSKPSTLKPALANLIPGYKMTNKLGQGAMGVVYKAIQESLGKEVAIKILPPDFARDRQKVERFIREAKALGQLHHPNIIRAIDRGQVRGYVYYVMEYVKGDTLDRVIQDSGSISENKTLQIARDLMGGLAHAWKYGIVHRDIKPENIMISQEGYIKICDLGLAKCMEQKNEIKLTMDGMTVGTPIYMSPEQARGEELDIRTDLYASGITLFEMLTGEPPYIHKSPIVVMQMHLTKEIPFLQDKLENISSSTSNLVYKLMSKEPQDRFESPSKVLEILENILSGKPYLQNKKQTLRKKGLKNLKKKLSKRKFKKRP